MRGQLAGDDPAEDAAVRHQATTSYSGARPRLPASARPRPRAGSRRRAARARCRQPQRGGQLARRERLAAEQRRRQQRRASAGRGRSSTLLEHLDEPPLARVAPPAPQHDRRPPARGCGPRGRAAPRPSDAGARAATGTTTSRSNTVQRPALQRRAPRRQHLAVLVHAHDPPLGRHRVHDPHAVAVQQRVELAAPAARSRRSGSRPARRRRAPGRSRSARTRTSATSPGRAQQVLDRRVQRPLAQHADPGHARAL